MAFYIEMHRLTAGLPKTPTDAMLAEGMDGQTTMARFHGLLNLLFEKA
jgi:hypothetical protein